MTTLIRSTRLRPPGAPAPGARASARLARHANGLIAVLQEGLNGWGLSYEPDWNRLCVERFDGAIVTTYAADDKGLANARYFMRHRTAPHGCTG